MLYSIRVECSSMACIGAGVAVCCTGGNSHRQLPVLCYLWLPSDSFTQVNNELSGISFDPNFLFHCADHPQELTGTLHEIHSMQQSMSTLHCILSVSLSAARQVVSQVAQLKSAAKQWHQTSGCSNDYFAQRRVRRKKRPDSTSTSSHNLAPATFQPAQVF